MPNYQQDLNLTFQALSDPTRRQVLEQLSRGQASVKELAEPFDMALPSFMQHLKMLERSALVRSQKKGRVRTFSIEPAQMETASAWLSEQLAQWTRRLDQLDSYVLELAKQEENKETNHE